MTHILLVEDDVELGRLMEHILLSARYEVDRAESVASARSHLARGTYDLVIADARLQDGTGMEVADRARESGVKAHVRTKIVTLKAAIWEGEHVKAKLALGIEGETSDRNLLHLVEWNIVCLATSLSRVCICLRNCGMNVNHPTGRSYD